MVREDLLICWLTLTLGGSALGACALRAWYGRRMSPAVPSGWLLDAVGAPDLSDRWDPPYRGRYRRPSLARQVGRWLGVAR